MSVQAVLQGMASLLDFSPLSDRRANILERSDEEALRIDWNTVGKDIEAAIKSFEAENAENG